MAEFPEVSEFLEKMQVKKSLFGYDKEDVKYNSLTGFIKTGCSW